MSIAVTTRPRRLRMPATSGGASGTRVSRSGTNTSCTREIGRPNSWSPIVTVTYSVSRSWRRCRCCVPWRSYAASIDVGGLLLERRDQALAVELGDVIVEADLAAALDRFRRAVATTAR